MKMFASNNDKKLHAFEREALPLMDELYNMAVKLTRDRYDAEDLLQDTYTRAWGAFHSYKADTRFRSWIYRIMMNTYINLYNRRKRSPFSGDFDIASSLHADHTAEAGQPWFSGSDYFQLFDDDICRAFDLLPEQFRIVVHLADVNGMTYQEISEVLNAPLGTVMSRLCRGRRLMLRYLSRTDAYRHRAGFAA